MSPERLSGAQYSYAADIWSFGMIMLELAKGAYPYPQVDSYFNLLSNIMVSSSARHILPGLDQSSFG